MPILPAGTDTVLTEWSRRRVATGGFVVFTVASIALALTPGAGSAAALWIIGWRLVQAVGGPCSSRTRLREENAEA